jgi:hypothetical protein
MAVLVTGSAARAYIPAHDDERCADRRDTSTMSMLEKSLRTSVRS